MTLTPTLLVAFADELLKLGGVAHLIKKAEVEYRGKTFPGYNKAVASDKKKRR